MARTLSPISTTGGFTVLEKSNLESPYISSIFSLSIPKFSRNFEYVSKYSKYSKKYSQYSYSEKFHSINSELNSVEKMKDAAKQTVDMFIRSNMTIGIGCGLISHCAIQYIGEKMEQKILKNITAVPMSNASALEAAKIAIPLSSLDLNPELNFSFTDADLVQEGTVFSIIGNKNNFKYRDCIIKEKKIIQCSKEFMFFISEPNFVQKLKGDVPVFIKKENWLDIAEEIDDLFLGEAEVWRRPTSGEADPMGGNFPLVTSSGHFVLDLIFSDSFDPIQVSQLLESVEGVEGHGLVMDDAYGVAVATAEGAKFRTALFKNAFITNE